MALAKALEATGLVVVTGNAPMRDTPNGMRVYAVAAQRSPLTIEHQ